ncbi:hypothetical protein M404DRAFT_11016 [Pisolithus tinctorius Marx 270]|uniref:Uncharacterized protein n=1 Tax=Pisolithus tinctorius Marx 270 TaxID=870435 RepID=A0A0C3IGD9_PISTI|nr:hypothetical protein M404DRAFT_11016 [Pisolithus tinctorius Marx 270]
MSFKASGHCRRCCGVPDNKPGTKSIYSLQHVVCRGDHDQMMVASPSSSLGPIRHERKIQNENMYMHWYTSHGPGPIQYPPADLEVEHTDLYLHLWGESAVQVWMWNRNKELWEPAKEGKAHPVLPRRRLRLQMREEPSWIMRKTATMYRGKQKCEVQ